MHADGREEDTWLESVRPGNRLRLRPGEKVPVDGVVLDGISTVLSKAADGLRECGVSRVIPPAEANIGSAYIVLQRGNTPGDSCEFIEKDQQSFSQKIDEKGGEVLIGILSIGLTILLIALPFIIL